MVKVPPLSVAVTSEAVGEPQFHVWAFAVALAAKQKAQKKKKNFPI
jgi:hypothetical protein